MKERPILFSGPMVRALLHGSKTQTRRVVDVPKYWELTGEVGRIKTPGYCQDFGAFIKTPSIDDKFEIDVARCPYGAPSDRLWVRENVGRKPAELLGIKATNGVESAFYEADGADILNDEDYNLCPWWGKGTLPSIFMPRWASRLTLEITDIRVERLQGISEEDAKAEGCFVGKATGRVFETMASMRLGGPEWANARDWYADLWDSINAKRGFGWGVNPWVWAITLRRIE